MVIVSLNIDSFEDLPQKVGILYTFGFVYLRLLLNLLLFTTQLFFQLSPSFHTIFFHEGIVVIKLLVLFPEAGDPRLSLMQLFADGL